MIACGAEGPARALAAVLERRLAESPAFDAEARLFDLPSTREALAVCASRLEPRSPPLRFATPDPEPLARRALATHRAHGRWFPDRLSADRHELSALWGLPALAHLFLRAHDPDRWSPLVDLLP